MNMITPEPEQLMCLEVRGGNTVTDEVITAADISIAIYASPFGNSSHGGDIHYISACSGDQIIRIALADVSGHGEGSAQLAQCLQDLMRDNIEVIDHTDFVRSLNEEFATLSTAGNFATALISAYYKPDNTLILCNAGHPPPLLYCAKNDAWSLLDDTAGNPMPGISDVPLGVIGGTDYTQIAVTINPGDRVVMYSDSLNESVDPAGKQLHEEGLLDLIAALPKQDGRDLCKASIDAVSAYRGGAAADDDESVLVIWRPE